MNIVTVTVMAGAVVLAMIAGPAGVVLGTICVLGVLLDSQP